MKPSQATLTKLSLAAPHATWPPNNRATPNEIDHRVDIYATGVVLYELLTGEPPSSDLSAPSQKIQVDVRIDEIVLKALNGEPHLRYESAAAFRTRIESYTDKSDLSSTTKEQSSTPKKSSWVNTIEAFFRTTFSHPAAIRFANWSALGFLGFLGSLYYVDPQNPAFRACAGLSGLFGLFGLIGPAFLIEFLSRSQRFPRLTAILPALFVGLLLASPGIAFWMKSHRESEIIRPQTTEPQDMNIKNITKNAATAVVATTMATSAPAEELQPVDEAARTELKEQARERMRQDRDEYTRQELGELEELYQVANKNWKTDKPKAKEAMEELVKNFKKANRTGCAMLYLGQLSYGDERDKHLDDAIKNYSDCYYGNGVQVGGWARYLRILDLRSDNKDAAADKLEKELRTDYPKAITHGGILLTAILDRAEAGKNGKTSPPKKTKDAEKKKAPADPFGS